MRNTNGGALFFLKGRYVQQYLHMNPYVAFGEDFFSTGRLPQYIVVNDPIFNPYTSLHQQEFTANYVLKKQYGRYQLYSLK